MSFFSTLSFRIACGSLVLGVLLCYNGWKDLRINDGASATPEEVSLQELITRGPNSNPNIILTHYSACPNYVFEEMEDKKSWATVWVPVVPTEEGAGGPQNPPEKVKAIVVCHNIYLQRELDLRMSRPKLKALVKNRIESLDSSERQLLQKQYPKTDFRTCLIIEDGGTLEHSQLGWYTLAGGVLFVFLSAGLIGYALWSTQSTRSRPRIPDKRKRFEDEDRARKDRRRGRRSRTDEDDDEYD